MIVIDRDCRFVEDRRAELLAAAAAARRPQRNGETPELARNRTGQPVGHRTRPAGSLQVAR